MNRSNGRAAGHPHHAGNQSVAQQQNVRLRKTMGSRNMHEQQDSGVTAWWQRALRCALCLTSFVVAAHAAAASAAPPSISGAGATFPGPLYQAWSREYLAAAGVEVRYQAVGSGLGLTRIEHREIDFGASDAPLNPEQLDAAGLIQFPVVVGGVLPVINITGIRPGELKLTGEVLAAIYSGSVRRWNDPAIAVLNPTLPLPNSNITVVHRSDASGSSLLWTTYLAAASDSWRGGVGASTTPRWPTGVAARGNEGVASYVQRTRYAIGYVEYYFARAHGLSDVALRNRSGRFVRARPDNFAAAVAASDWRDPVMTSQLPTDAAGEQSWPVTGATFILIARQAQDVERERSVLKFFDWALHRGAGTVDQLDYASLPQPVIDRLPALWKDVRGADGQAVWP